MCQHAATLYKALTIHLDVRACGLDGFTRALESSARAVSRDPVVETLTLEILDNLGTRRPLVHVRVRLRDKLVEVEVPVLCRKLLCLRNHPRALGSSRCQNDLRTNEHKGRKR